MYAVVRVRGSTGVRKEVEDTLKMLRLNSVNHCIILPETKEYLGMLNRAKDYITWGEINSATLSKLLKKRAKTFGNKSIDEKNLKEITEFDNFDELSDALISGKVRLKDFKAIKPVFRLNPPRHGYKATRLPYPKGDLGDRKEKINELLERMI